jgi:hypothetical protein
LCSHQRFLILERFLHSFPKSLNLLAVVFPILFALPLTTVRNERGMGEEERWLKHQHRAYCLGRSPVEGDPSTRTYRLGVVIGEQCGGETPLGRKVLAEWCQTSLGEARGGKW